MLTIIVESFPPNPNELHITCFRFCPVSVCVTGAEPSIGVEQPRVAGINPFCMAKRHITVSMLPDALVVCPVNDLVDENGGIRSPKTRLNASISVWSLFGVAVPCAFT